MINEYIKQCKYDIGSLKDYIYLFPIETTFFNLSYDYENGNNGYISTLSYERCLKCYCHNVTFNSSESIDERFKFNDILTFRIGEQYESISYDKVLDLIKNKYYIGFENKDNEVFILSTQTIPFVTYNYNYSQNNFYVELNFSVNQNVPFFSYTGQMVESFLEDYNNIGCDYKHNNFIKLDIGEYGKILFSDYNSILTGAIMTENNVLKNIDFIKNTVTFNESNTNGYILDTISFSIPLSEYKFNLHYDLLQFVNNIYTAIIQTELNNVIILENLFPSYIVETSNDDSTLNLITITLTRTNSYKGLIYSTKDNYDDIIDGIEIEDFIYSPVNIGNLCYDEGIRAHTLIQKFSFTGQPLDEYYCLLGYENIYNDDYNIVGTYPVDSDMFGFDILYEDSSCTGKFCFIENLPSIIYFYGLGEQSFTLETTCSFHIAKTDNGLTVTPMQSTSSTPIKIENTDGKARETLLYFTFENGEIRTVKVIVYEYSDIRYVEDGTICSSEELDNSLCEKWEEIPYIEGNSNTYICVNGNKYKKLVRYYSEFCNGEWKSDNDFKNGDLIEENSDDCLSYNCDEEWLDVEGEYICEAVTNCQEWRTVPYNKDDKNSYICYNGNKYYKEQLYIDENCNGNYEQTQSFQTGDLIEENSYECGYIDIPEGSSGNTLEFTFSGSSLNYTVNSLFYLADESPYQKTLEEIGITSISNPPALSFRNCFNYTFNGGAKLLTFDKIPTLIQLTNTYGMFAGQDKLQGVNLAYVDVNRLNDARYMFQNCSSLTTISFDSWTKSNGQINYIQLIDYMFDGCNSLRTIYMRNCPIDMINNIKDALFEANILNNVEIVTE